MAEPIHCPECGNPLEKDHIICRKCGLLLPIKQREQAILAKLSDVGTGPGTPFPDLGSEIAGDLLPAITVQMAGGESGLKAGQIAACEACAEAGATSRGARCSVCSAWLCPGHAITCGVCKKTFCSEHIHRSCSLCDDYVCQECLFRCPVCDGIVGTDHLQECDHCGQVICKNCVSDVGVIVKKKYCKNRCDLVTEETRKQGLFRKLIDKIRMK